MLKKPCFSVRPELEKYLETYNRTIRIPVFYDDLLRFAGSVEIRTPSGEDTLWERVYYSDFERNEIDNSLKKIYTLLHSDGNETVIKHLNIDAIDFCDFGNSKPFRIKIRNILNDNYTYFYVKKTDASRIYGLELEHMLSPYNLNFLVYRDTLIEEHISGIPGDIFMKDHLSLCSEPNKVSIAKEFVKFNERCIIRLLGDMRSYNYVIIPSHDWDHIVYKIRAIDFDQQCYEGDLDIYRPIKFKENETFSKLIREKLDKTSIMQYRIEERSMVAKRIISYDTRIKRLVDCICADTISTPENIERLKTDVFLYAKDLNFRKSTNMGEILKSALMFIKRNYDDISPKYTE